MPADHDGLIDGGAVLKERFGDVEAQHANGSTAGGFSVVKQAAFGKIGADESAVVGGGADREDSADFIFTGLHRIPAGGNGHRDFEQRVGRLLDDAVDLVGVFGADGRAIGIVPPIFDAAPRPFLDVEDVVAEHREAFCKTGVDAADGRAHERDGDDADDDPERREHRAQLVRSDLSEGDAKGLGELVKEALHVGGAKRGSIDRAVALDQTIT